MKGEDDGMNLGRMCEAAARYSDRYDEYVKADGGQFEGEALHWFNLFRDAVNEAYFEIARGMKQPQEQMEMELKENRVIDLSGLEPEAASLIGIYRMDGLTGVPFVFRTRQLIEVTGAKPGEKVMIRWQYLPARLETERDEPVFPESLADPMIYIALATARVWQSERRMSDAQIWINEYYRRLRELRPTMKTAGKQRLPRTLFR